MMFAVLYLHEHFFQQSIYREANVHGMHGSVVKDKRSICIFIHLTAPFEVCGETRACQWFVFWSYKQCQDAAVICLAP